MALPPGASRKLALFFNISGQSFCAPKFENSHHLRAGLAFTEPRNRPQPATVRSAEKSATPRIERFEKQERKRGTTDVPSGMVQSSGPKLNLKALVARPRRARRRGLARRSAREPAET